MKRWSNQHQLRLVTEISITPLLDLVFVLLFVFLLAAPLLKKDAALMLPATTGGGAAPAPAQVVELSITKDELMLLDSRPVNRDVVEQQLRQISVDKPGAGVLVKMDRELPVQRLVEVMDLLKKVGIQRTAVAAIQPDGA